MPLSAEIEDIKKGLKAGQYTNEASVSQGIILRLLINLGWPIFDAAQVSPEHPVGKGFVDYALCHPPKRPVILVESKNLGKAFGAEKQLFEYAFHEGIQMAILTDGQEWSFFLPGEKGDYSERCVYKLDLFSRDINESCHIFERYLKKSEVISGNALRNARDDYESVNNQRQIEITLPQAWSDILKEQDEILVELIAEKVQTICGLKPEPDMVRSFLDQIREPKKTVPPPTQLSKTSTLTTQPTALNEPGLEDEKFSGFIMDGQKYNEGNAIKTLIRVFEVLNKRDPKFLERFAALPKHGKKRRFLAQDKMDLYPNRPDLCEEYSRKFVGGWWIGTNYSRSVIRHAIELACEVAGLRFGQDVKLI